MFCKKSFQILANEKGEKPLPFQISSFHHHNFFQPTFALLDYPIMGFFTVNKKQLSAVHSSNSSVSSKGSNTTKTSRSSSVSYKPTHSTKKNVSSNGRAQASSKGPRKSANIKAVECFLDNMNNFTTVDNFLIPFTSRDTPIKPEDFPAIRMETFAQIMEGIHKSFPDVHFQYKSISESIQEDFPAGTGMAARYKDLRQEPEWIWNTQSPDCDKRISRSRQYPE